MKRIISVISAVLLTAGLHFPVAYATDIPEVSARAAVVISADTGEIIYSKNCEEKLPMASTTKIMTALLCIESGNLDEPFVVDSKAIHVEGSSMGLQEGDIVTKYALCCGMLLPSGNDAANAAAVKIAGSNERFAEIMNARAQQMGLSKTYFVTPSGLEGDGHGSSAYDMAVLSSHALRNKVFRDICSCENIKLEFGNPPYTRWLRNTNKLLSLYGGTYGVKTGFTDEAGRCLVSACERGDLNLICVTLNDRNDWDDHMNMYDYAFERVHTIHPELPEDLSIPLAGSDKDYIKARPSALPEPVTVLEADEKKLTYTVISPPFIYAPVKTGDELGELSIRYDGNEIRRIPLNASEDAEYSDISEKAGRGTINNIISKLRKLFS